jgi:glucan phosphorylase
MKYPPTTADGKVIAYFSAEYGLTECLPVYSGGLGILSGDHMKSASDLDLPLVGVALLYQLRLFPPASECGRLAAGTVSRERFLFPACATRAGRGW